MASSFKKNFSEHEVPFEDISNSPIKLDPLAEISEDGIILKQKSEQLWFSNFHPFKYTDSQSNNNINERHFSPKPINSETGTLLEETDQIRKDQFWAWGLKTEKGIQQQASLSIDEDEPSLEGEKNDHGNTLE